MLICLSSLLSRALVAFTIELDNEFEHRTPHRTTMLGGSGPWLASAVMWSNCMRFVDEDGITIGELESRARTKTNLDGMRRWGYVTLEPPRAGKSAKKPNRNWTIRATVKGALARRVWEPLFPEIESRWLARFPEAVRLRESLRAVAAQLDPSLPDCLPILEYGLYSRHETKSAGADAADLDLFALMSRVLLEFALEFESGSPVSLAISANVLRVLEETGTAVRDLPRLSGVSKESIAMALGFLKKRGLIAVAGREAGLTSAGCAARQWYLERVAAIEKRWQVAEIRKVLEAIAPRLFEGLEPYPEGWRAKIARPETLPHFPMVLHRGGYPDGS